MCTPPRTPSSPAPFGKNDFDISCEEQSDTQATQPSVQGQVVGAYLKASIQAMLKLSGSKTPSDKVLKAMQKGIEELKDPELSLFFSKVVEAALVVPSTVSPRKPDTLEIHNRNRVETEESEEDDIYAYSPPRSTSENKKATLAEDDDDLYVAP
jgi:hypothetical protein